MRAKFRQIEVPAHLKSEPPDPGGSAAADHPSASLVAQPDLGWLRRRWCCSCSGWPVRCSDPETPDRFANFQTRMVSQVLREYRMDLVTNDMQQIRQFMAQRGAPADYDVPQGLEHLQLTGGGLLKWRNHPVSMVCFDRGDKQMLFLFVMKRSGVKDPPPETPRVTRVHQMVTASWTRGDNTYVLAGPEDPDFVRKYL